MHNYLRHRTGKGDFMKKLLTLVLSVFLTGALSLVFAGGAGGQKIFKKNGCTTCHHPTKDQLGSGLGPSLQMVAKAYKGNKAGLVKFLSGKAKPIVAPKKFGIMKTQLRKTKKLKDADRSALADYILSN